MSDTQRIKRFEEWKIFVEDRNNALSRDEERRLAAEFMLNSLAEHIERLERRYQEHRHDDGTGILSCTPTDTDPK